MKRFIRELRRREVIRTAGLYVGAGLLWYLFLLTSVLRRARSHTFGLLKPPRRRQLLRWTLLNAAIAAIAVAIILILRRM